MSTFNHESIERTGFSYQEQAILAGAKVQTERLYVGWFGRDYRKHMPTWRVNVASRLSVSDGSVIKHNVVTRFLNRRYY